MPNHISKPERVLSLVVAGAGAGFIPGVLVGVVYGFFLGELAGYSVESAFWGVCGGFFGGGLVIALAGGVIGLVVGVVDVLLARSRSWWGSISVTWLLVGLFSGNYFSGLGIPARRPLWILGGGVIMGVLGLLYTLAVLHEHAAQEARKKQHHQD